MNSKIKIGQIKDVSNGKITYTDPFLTNVTYTVSIHNIIQLLEKGFVNSNSFFFIDIVNKSMLINIDGDGDITDIERNLANYEQHCSFIFFIPYFTRLLISNCGTLIGNGYLKKTFTKPILGVYERIPLNTGEIGYLISHTDGTLLFVLW